MPARIILLSSATEDKQASRSFNEFDNKDDLARKLIDYYEDYLYDIKVLEPNNENEGFEYSSDGLFEFLDTFFAELVCLVQQEESPELWIPFATDWVKEQVYLYLRGQTESKRYGYSDDPKDMDTSP